MMRTFTLKSLLIGVAFLSGYSDLSARWPVMFGFLAIPIGMVALASMSTSAGVRVNYVGIVTAASIVVILVVLLLPSVRSPRGPSHRNGCQNNLHQLGLALANYHAVHGCYPPAYIADAQGKPLVSWRVLILPYMDKRALYDKWKQHRDEPWNGPNNIKISRMKLDFLHCPSDPGSMTDTSYVAVVGPRTIWPGTTQVSDSQITDGTSNTILLVEVANSGINWMEPRDLDFTRRAPGVNAKSGLGVSSAHPAVACVQVADGRTVTIPTHLSEQDLQALLTIDGGEKVKLP